MSIELQGKIWFSGSVVDEMFNVRIGTAFKICDVDDMKVWVSGDDFARLQNLETVAPIHIGIDVRDILMVNSQEIYWNNIHAVVVAQLAWDIQIDAAVIDIVRPPD